MSDIDIIKILNITKKIRYDFLETNIKSYEKIPDSEIMAILNKQKKNRQIGNNGKVKQKYNG